MTLRWKEGGGPKAEDGKAYSFIADSNGWVISRGQVDGKWRYVLWEGKSKYKIPAGGYDSAAEAQAEADRRDG